MFLPKMWIGCCKYNSLLVRLTCRIQAVIAFLYHKGFRFTRLDFQRKFVVAPSSEVLKGGKMKFLNGVVRRDHEFFFMNISPMVI